MVRCLTGTRCRPNADLSIGSHDDAHFRKDCTDDALKLYERLDGFADIACASPIAVKDDDSGCPVRRYILGFEEVPIEGHERAVLSP
jgi:hypothetical protein